MGKRRHRGSRSEDKKRRKDHAKAWASVRGDEQNKTNSDNWTPWNLNNKRFEAFYKAQKITNDCSDYERFLYHLRQPLPACFRIYQDYAFASVLQQQLHEFAGQKITVDNQEIEAVEQMAWYPGGFGYKLGTDRRSIRKLDALDGLHKWLMRHTDTGNITRQEAVSMVPPLALNVKPGHKCLDMCAAPGSKTSQLLEIVNRSLTNSEDEQGLVVANDADTERAYMLSHQCKRINSPLLVVTTHKGQEFPTIRDNQKNNAEFFDRILCDVPCSGDGTLRKNPAIWSKWSTKEGITLHPLQLIIAQRGFQLLKPGGLLVYSTCSMSPYEDEAVVAQLLRQYKGSFELVDAREFLPKFHCRAGRSDWLVLDDTSAAKREKLESKNRKMKGNNGDNDKAEAVDEVDGTAALDEKADEIDSARETADGDDQSNSSPAADWSHIEDPDLRSCLEMGMISYSSFEEVPAHLRSRLRNSIFPPTQEEASWMHLERCLRCLPQDEDTGGFFVATLRKLPSAHSDQQSGTKESNKSSNSTSVVEEDNREESASTESAAVDSNDKLPGTEEGSDAVQQTTDPEARAKSKGLVDFRMWDEAQYNKIIEFYGIDRKALPLNAFFIRDDQTNAVRNNKGGGVHQNLSGKDNIAKSVYLLPFAARQLLQGDTSGRLKIVNAGMKVFEKHVNKRSGVIDYRLLQEGIAHVAPHITKRILSVNIQEFCNLLEGGLVSYSTLHKDTITALSTLPHGVVICSYKYSPNDQVDQKLDGGDDSNNMTASNIEEKKESGEDHVLYVIGWKGYSRTMNVMCGKVEMDHIKHQLQSLGVYRPKINAVRLEASVDSNSAQKVDNSSEQDEQTELNNNQEINLAV